VFVQCDCSGSFSLLRTDDTLNTVIIVRFVDFWSYIVNQNRLLSSKSIIASALLIRVSGSPTILMDFIRTVWEPVYLWWNIRVEFRFWVGQNDFFHRYVRKYPCIWTRHTHSSETNLHNNRDVNAIYVYVINSTVAVVRYSLSAETERTVMFQFVTGLTFTFCGCSIFYPSAQD